MAAHIRVTVSMVSGESAAAIIGGQSTVADLGSHIETLLGVPLAQQLLQLSSSVNLTPGSAEGAFTLGDVGITDDDTVHVIRCDSVALAPLPPHFRVECTSSRERLGLNRYSSAFAILYKVMANILEGKLELELWRKSDHDRLLFDTEAGTLSNNTSHWMSGSQTSETPLHNSLSLADMLARLIESSLPVHDNSKRFWKPPGFVASKDDRPVRHPRIQEEKVMPDYGIAPGWFVAPEDGCTELRTECPLPWLSRGSRARTRLEGALINEEGILVRVAVFGLDMPGHDSLEEYDVTLEAVEGMATAGCDAGDH